MMNMANVINEFLYSVSKGFSDTIVDEQSVINGNEIQENQYVGLHE